MTRVVHCKHEKYDVYIGRPSKWGNPFRIGKDGNREEVIQKFRDYFYLNPKLMVEAIELRNKVLGCFCKPKNCHGDILAEFANSIIPLEPPHEEK